MRTDPIPLNDAERWEHLQSDSEDFRCVALIGADVCGVAYVRRGAGRARLTGSIGVTVDPYLRGFGIGARLASECIALAERSGLLRIESFPFATNAPGIRMLRSVGFVVEGTLTRRALLDDGTHDDCVVMARLLTSTPTR